MADEQQPQQLDLGEYNGGALIGVAIVCLSLSWIAVGLRIYTRAVLTKRVQIDDWLMIISQIIFTASCTFVFLGVKKGMGRHNDAITNDDVKIAALMWQALATATYIINMMFIKLSIGVFLLRVSARRLYNYIIWTSLGIIVVWSLVIFFWDIFQCSPVKMQWDYRIQDGKCFPPSSVVAAAYAISAMTIASDWLYAILPVPMLWSVKMTQQAKITVIAILGLGIFASVATIIRLRYLHTMQDTADILYGATEVMIWTIVEPGVAIVASSLATIRPLLRAMKIQGFGSTGYTHSLPSRNTRYPDESRGTTAPIRGFSPDDNDVEQAESSTKNIGLTFELEQHHSLAQGIPAKGDVRTEVYAITESKQHSPTWSPHDEEANMRNPSFDDFSFEERSQDSGHVGLAVSTKRS